MKVEEFKKIPVLGILRNVNEELSRKACEAAIAGGLRAIEYSLTTPNANFLIQDANVRYSEQMFIGAGTVMSVESARAAIASGASFIVSPHMDTSVADFCAASSIPYIPGVMTPTEIAVALKHKPTLLKLFPAALMGAGYVSEMLGPFPTAEFMAVGGITPENAGEYFTAGVKAVGFGKSIFKKELIEAGKWEEITGTIAQFVAQAKSHALVK